ncbi:MAG: SipW-dependent-type signal peptide-containing protein [Lachnospirales bacterium]
MKKKILLVAALTICLAIAVSGTLAYFTAEDTVHNVITSGGVNIKVVEKMQNKDGVLVDFPEEGMKGIMPGADVSKIVSVENTGESETWIRVKVEAKITSADDKELPVDVMDYEVSENWHMDFDGYIYYAKPVAPGESTEILFDTVYFAPEMGNEYQNCTANIVICAQAVQTANNGKNVLEAQGWPAEK